jgi:hypothetical protein
LGAKVTQRVHGRYKIHGEAHFGLMSVAVKAVLPGVMNNFKQIAGAMLASKDYRQYYRCGMDWGISLPFFYPKSNSNRFATPTQIPKCAIG